MERGATQEYFGEVRAFFAPVGRTDGTGAVFDPAVSFDLENPPAPWVNLGDVRNFKRVSKTDVEAVRTGPGGVVQSQFRKVVDARVSFDFCEWGKLQMALAASSRHMNVLESSGAQEKASGGAAKAGNLALAGSTARHILLDASVLGEYSAGELVVVDVDYAADMQNLGTGITGGVAGANAVMDADAVRRVSYNVACVSAVTATYLQLDAPLLGGAPVSGARVQKVRGFVDREGASFFQEWSAVFALEEASGGRVYFHYPRLQSASPAEETETALAGAGSEASGLSGLMLHAGFVALPSTDANDGETVVCYRSYIPASGAAAY